jgi:hypothetical protein
VASARSIKWSRANCSRSGRSGELDADGHRVERNLADVGREHLRPFANPTLPIYVPHRYEFARRLFDARRSNASCLRAVRCADGTRTFRVRPAETSFGVDLYEEVFESAIGAGAENVSRKPRDNTAPSPTPLT